LIKLVDLGYLKEMKPSWAKILVAIIAHIGKDGWAEVDQDTLAKEAGVSRRSVNNFISWARDAGLLIVDRRKRNRYSLGFEKRPKFADLCQGMIKKGQLAKLFWQHVKVLLALYRHRNKQGFAFPTKRLLAKEAGVSVDTVSRFLDRAWLAELIDIQPGKNSHRRKPFGPSVGQSPEVSRRRSNTYRLTWGEKAKLEWLTPLERPRLKRAEKTELPNI
jgi:lambda repressor-like predicted transcriptional regulator